MPRTLLVVSQTFVPDPASVGQHMADVAFEMARRGQRVVVYTSSRSYEDASIAYPLRETRNGVDIRRIRFSSFGKRSILLRVFGTASFMVQVFLRMLFFPRLAGIFFSTSPPLVGLAATIVAMIRRVPTAYWAMDLNPDQLISMGKLRATSWRAKFLEGVNRFILRRTNLIIALDRFMAERILQRGDYQTKLLVQPPWPHEDAQEPVPHLDNPFRQRHGLDGKFVIMYSGNHSPANPLKTLLDAAVKLKDHPTIQLMFIGGGLGKREVEEYKQRHQLDNVISLPYQPLDSIRWSLSA
ncbi:MAG: glycosyltransferase family 4 protein, partial [Planctomycetota bacterium]|nr:glycosyltransferase family 4 protein [Planctomycetota bacterium]